MKDVEELSAIVIDVSLRLHKELGPGLFESVYEIILAEKLIKMDLPLGLLINFGGATLKEGIRRLVNNHTNFASSRLRANKFQ